MARYFTRVYGGIAPGYTERVLAKNKAADETNPIFAIVAKAASHPPTSTMVNSAIKILNQRNGSSHRAIKNWISKTYTLDMKKLSPDINKYLITAVESGVLIQIKGKGARVTFKLPLASISKTKATFTPKKKPASAKKAKSIEMKSLLDDVTPPKRTTAATSTTKTPVSTGSKKSSSEVKPTKSSIETKAFKKTAATKSATETPMLTRSKTSSSFKPTKSVETKVNFKRITAAKSTTKTSVTIERRKSLRIINATKVSAKEMESSSKKVTRPKRATRNTPAKRAPFRQR